MPNDVSLMIFSCMDYSCCNFKIFIEKEYVNEVLAGSVGVCISTSLQKLDVSFERSLRPDGDGKLAEIDSTGAWIRKATLGALSLPFRTVAEL